MIKCQKRKRFNAIKDSDIDAHSKSSDNQDKANDSSSKKKNKVRKETSKDPNISISSKKESFLILKRNIETQDNLITERRAAKSKQRIDVQSIDYADDSNKEESDAATNIRSKNKPKNTKQKTEITKRRRDVNDSNKEESEMDEDSIVGTKMQSKSKIKPNKQSSKINTGITKRRSRKSISYAEDSDESVNEEVSNVGIKMQSKSKLKRTKQPSKKITSITNKKKDEKSINYAIDSNEEDSEKDENIAAAKDRLSKNKLEHTKQSSKKSSGLTKHGRGAKSINSANYFSSEEESNNSSEIKDIDPENIKDLKCYYCGTIFKTYLSLNSHIRLHHIPYKCPICYDGDSTFKKRYKYKYHMKIFHPEIGPYPCDYPKCSKNFYKEKELRDHMKIHKPFMCKFCKKNFVLKRFMKLHVQNNH